MTGAVPVWHRQTARDGSDWSLEVRQRARGTGVFLGSESGPVCTASRLYIHAGFMQM